MISICLATFNGEQFLKRQLDTILEQIGESDEIIVVDDCSSDSTIKLIKEIGDKRLKITLNSKNSGVVKTFERAISLAIGDYIFLSDQDDVWFHDKIKVTFMKMHELEMLYGNTIPLLVHTDLAVGNENLKIISNSFCKFQRVNPYRGNAINRLLVQNNITGCTVMINKPLRDLALPISGKAIMHDWWIGMVASCFGKIGFVDKPTIIYRQHSHNDIGAKKYNFAYILKMFYKINEMTQSYEKSRIQAMAFLQSYEERLDAISAKIIKDYIELINVGLVRRIRMIFKREYFKSTLCRNVGFVLMMLYYNKINKMN